jgi:hypothetical protein
VKRGRTRYFFIVEATEAGRMARRWGVKMTALATEGRAVDKTLPYDAATVKEWHRQPRRMHAAPPPLLYAYGPIAALPFRELVDDESVKLAIRADYRRAPPVFAAGDVGLGLALDATLPHPPLVSVEAAALYQLVQEADGGGSEGDAAGCAALARALHAEWVHGMCAVMTCEATGWRGCFAEHRIWSALLRRHDADAALRTPHAHSVVRGWYPPVVLDDLEACVGRVTALDVARRVADLDFNGAPDLLLYRRGRLRFVEVKSASDRFKSEQLAMMRNLLAVPGATYEICAPRRHLARLEGEVAAGLVRLDDTTDDEAG